MKTWWLILLLLGVAVGFVLAHTLPHDLTAPVWEHRRDWGRPVSPEDFRRNSRGEWVIPPLPDAGRPGGDR
jgi:hypothetical protein